MPAALDRPPAPPRPTAHRRRRLLRAAVVSAAAVVVLAALPAAPAPPAAAAGVESPPDLSANVLPANVLPANVLPVDAGAPVVRLVVDSPAAAVAAKAAAGGEVVLANDVFAAVDVPAGDVAEARAAAVAAGASWVEGDAPAFATDVRPADPLFVFETGLHQMDVPGAWLASQGDPATVIAVLDSGVATVPELDGRVLEGVSFFDGQPARVPAGDGVDDSHGTMSAVVAAGAAGNGVGAAGPCHRCSVLPVRVFAQGSAFTSMAVVAAGVVAAADAGADVISMSLAGPSTTTALSDAVAYALARGSVVVASAGNTGGTSPMYPAGLPGVVGVAGVNGIPRLYSWSSRGPSVQFAAHGCNTAQDDEGVVRSFCGTSSAAPLLAGVLALRLSQASAAGAALSPAALAAEASAVRSPVPEIAGGMVDASALLGVPAVRPTPTGTAGNPVGSVTLRRGATGVSAWGWAYDPNTDRPVTVTLTRPGGASLPVAGLADRARPDVAFPPGLSARHGFALDAPGWGAAPSVCLSAANMGQGVPDEHFELTLRCRTFALAPTGQVSSASPVGPGAVRVAGFAFDPDGNEATSVRVYRKFTSGGVARTETLGTATAGGALAAGASAGSPPVPAHSPPTTANAATHSFSLVVQTAARGPITVCAEARVPSLPQLRTAQLGCRTVTVPTGPPVGSLEATAHAGPRLVRAAGWALDPDTSAPVAVHAYVDGRFAGSATASGARTDVWRAYPGYGSAHGFSFTVPATAGSRSVCLYAINVAAGSSNTLLGCRTVVVRGGSPVGSVDSVALSSGSVVAQGWALDFDTDAPVAVHVYVNGRFTTQTLANLTRTDVARLHPGYSAARGWRVTAPAVRGADVCVYAVNASGAGGNTLLGCRAAP
jgi:hypothetical protein